MRIATIDVGTNTAELLVADVQDGAIDPIHEEERFVRLGAGVDARGEINAEALDRLKNALIDLRQGAEQHEADRVIVGATSASRDAANKQTVVDFVQKETGLSYNILSGKEEATWTFIAACAAYDDLTGRCAVLDIGGGSTEVIVGRGNVRGPDAIEVCRSLDIGTVRLTERFFERQPPDPKAIARAEALINQTLESAAVPLQGDIPVLGNSGTTVALALVHAGPQARWSDLDADQRMLPAEVVHEWRDRLLRATVDEVKAWHPTAMHGRADVFPMGMLILDCFLQNCGIEALRVSSYQLRHGLLFWDVARREDGADSGR